PSGTTHTLGWSGLLGPSRGGTGADLSSFTTGSIRFFDGSSMAESNNLSWDDTSNLLTLGGYLQIPTGSGGVKLIGAASAIQFYSDDTFTTLWSEITANGPDLISLGSSTELDSSGLTG